MFPDVDQMGLDYRGAEHVVGPTLPWIAVDDEAREGVQEREGEPEQFRDVPHDGLRHRHGPACRAQLESDIELSNRRAEDDLEKDGIHEEDDYYVVPVHTR